MEEHLDKFRMYGLVPYNISPIQQGIQYGHALQEYNNFISAVRKNKELAEGTEDETKVEELLNEFDEWRLRDKTFIHAIKVKPPVSGSKYISDGSLTIPRSINNAESALPKRSIVK